MEATCASRGEQVRLGMVTVETGVVTREELYDLVWSIPMTKVADKFQVSSSYLARVCTELRVPRPERGYWAKLAVGKAAKAPSLPEPRPGDQMAWSRKDGLPTPPVPKPHPATEPRARAPRPIRRVTGTHSLVLGAKELFLAGREVKESEHLKPYKKLLVDVTASITGLDKALGFANDLFNALESAGYRVVIAPPDAKLRRESVYEKEEPPRKGHKHDPYGYSRLWSPQRTTVVYIDALAFGLSIVEMTESVAVRYVNGKYVRESEYVAPKASRRHVDHTWTSTHDLPSGRLRLVVYAPQWNVSWSTTFQETKTHSLASDIPRIIKTLKNSIATVTEKLAEAKRQAEIREQEWLAAEKRRLQEEDQRREAQSIKDSRDELEQVIQAWARAFSLERFFQGIEDRATALPEADRQAVLLRLGLAREFVGTHNPLDFFLGWKSPLERYVPLAQRNEVDDSGDGDNSGQE